MTRSATSIGLVDGSVETDSRRFYVVLDDEAVVQLDEVVAVMTELPGGRRVTHYGIVTELLSRFEGAELPSDTARVVDGILPGEPVRRAEVRILRVVPELFISPHAGASVERATGDHRAAALFEDEMTRGMLPLGLARWSAAVSCGRRGGEGGRTAEESRGGTEEDRSRGERGSIRPGRGRTAGRARS